LELETGAGVADAEGLGTGLGSGDDAGALGLTVAPTGSPPVG
jgi:hypothetical protein